MIGDEALIRPFKYMLCVGWLPDVEELINMQAHCEISEQLTHENHKNEKYGMKISLDQGPMASDNFDWSHICS